MILNHEKSEGIKGRYNIWKRLVCHGLLARLIMLSTALISINDRTEIYTAILYYVNRSSS